MAVYRKTYWSPRLFGLKERLVEEPFIFPNLFLVSVGLALILTEASQLILDPRLGQFGTPVAFESAEANFPKIWYSLALQDEALIVTSQDRKVFTLPLAKGEMSDSLESLREHIEETALEALRESVTVGLASRARFKVVLSLDQKLAYEHIKPMLQLLGEARLTQISFETRLIAVDAGEEKKVHL